jgi:hypothetical protein
MRGRIAALAALGIAAVAIGIPAAVSSAKQRHDRGHTDTVSHVLLISVDGLHQSDLEWYVANHPGSALAKLVNRGAEYSNAHTPVPSDSDPGMTAQMTGGDPRTTGVYYDVEYNHDVFPPGTPSTGCTGPAPGGDVIYDSPDDRDVSKLDAGEGLTGLPDSILGMTGNPDTVPPTTAFPFTGLLNPATFPVDPTTCQPIPPHGYLKVNTIMNVIHDAGLRTAWSDKHAVYESFNGPSGNGMDDFFAPEIDSDALHHDGSEWSNPPIAWTGDNAATMQYDDYKVQAVINWIDGLNHQGTQHVGTPAIYGMNFQTVSTAEKLPTSDGLTGGYLPGTDTPGPLLRRALDYINNRIGQMVEEIRDRHQEHSTAIIISAKHGQSPLDPNQLTRIDDGPIIDNINAAWDAAHPGAGKLIVAGTDDDAWQSYVVPKTQAAADFVKNYLWTHDATGNTASGGTRTLHHSGLARIYAGQDAATFFGVPVSDPRHPDVWGTVQVGVVYTGGHGKIAEHGGDNPGDRDVPILVYAPGVVDRQSSGQSVETTQIAPTILHLLGLDPNDLQAVQQEGTRVLPGL